MTSAQLVLVSVTSALVAVFVMLVVATVMRARSREGEVDDEAQDLDAAAGRDTATDRESRS